MGKVLTLPTRPKASRSHACCPAAERFLASHGLARHSDSWEIRAPMPPGTEPMGYALVRPIKYCPWCGINLLSID